MDTDPSDGTNYTANAAFGSGDQIGTGNWVVYKGTGTSVNVTGLGAGTTYHFAIYEYNTAGTMHNLTELTGNITTGAASATLNAATLASALTATYPSASAAVSFTASGTGLTENILATAQTGYEVSTDNSSFSGSVSVASGTTVYVRFAASLDAGDYNSATAVVLSSAGAANVNVTTSSSGNTVSKATPSISVAPSATSITYGQTLADSTLSGGSASVAGSFEFTTPSTAPAAGTASQGVTFTPSDTANYNTASTSSSVTVNKATPVLNITSASSAFVGATVSLTSTSPAASVSVSASTGAITYTSSNTSVATISSTTLTAVAPGTTTITASQAADSNYEAVSSEQVFTVNLDHIPLNALDSAAMEDFDTLASSGTSSLLPNGWAISESGGDGNYTAGTGSGTSGDTYSFGAASDPERALGGLRSGSVNPTWGAKIRNNTGQAITTVDISYVGEQWRLGATGRSDTLTFQYSTDATSLTTGTWTTVAALGFTAPVSSGSTGALDGNASGNRTAVSGSITGVSISSGADFWIRWLDNDATSADDGIGIDDISITAPAAATPAITLSPASLTDVSYEYLGGPSSAQTFDLSAVSLDPAGATVTINATGTDYEVSSDNSTFSDTVTLTASGGTIASTTRYVRLRSGRALGDYNSQNITVTGGSASANLTVSGSVTPNTIFSENMGTPGSTTATDVYTGFQNYGVGSISFNGTSDVRTSSASSGYTGASGSGNAYIAATIGNSFQINGINTLGYSSINCTFGIYKNTSSGDGTDLPFEYSTDGTNWTAISFSAMPASASWVQRTVTGLPAASNLRIRWRQTAVDRQYRIDDVVVTGLKTPTIAASGTPAALSTTYGTASSSTSFTINGTFMTAGILVTPPSGFEVSMDGTTYSSTVTVGSSGNITNTTVYLRLAAAATVGSKSGNVVLSSSGASNLNVATTASTVNPKALTISGISIANKTYDGNDSATISGSAAYSGLENGESHSVTGSPTAIFTSASVGTNIPVTVSGYTAPNANYSISQPTGFTANITAASVTVTAGNQTKVFGASDPALTYTSDPASLIAGNSFTGSLTRAAGSGVGTYAISQGTLSAGSNYTITFVGANLTITQATPSITADPTASTITSGEALSASSLTGGTASVAGSFAFTSPGTVPSPGVSSQGVTFTPADTGNYTTQTTSVDVGVLCVAPTLTRASSPTASGFTIHWSAVPGAGNYTVIHSANKTMSSATSVDTASTSLALTDLSEGLRYVLVRANNAAGASANSTMQVNHLHSLAAGATRYLSVPGMVNGGNATIAEKFGSANEAGLAAGGNASASTNIILLNADGSSQAGVYYHSGNWIRGGSIVNDEVIPAGKAFMLKNNSATTNHILLVATPATGPRNPVALSTNTNFTLVAPTLSTPATITTIVPVTPQVDQGGNSTIFKASGVAFQADQVIVPSENGQPAQIYFYHPTAKGGAGWFVGGRRVTTETIPAGRAVFIRRAADSSLETWTPPADE